MLAYLIPLIVVFVALMIYAMVLLRVVVNTNEVHIVQSRKSTTSYGKDTGNGNTYYRWPSWIPVFGVTTTALPVSVFDISLKNYEAYDQGRVPFLVDVIGFFRINDTNLAAQRVQNFPELEAQLTIITQGSVRTVLASHDIDSIMVERSKFGTDFTKEVQEQLKDWGVVPVKNLELMDIRDVGNGQSIANIMAKKISLIEMQTRIEVAQNKKNGQIAEINAQQEAKTQEQAALEIVGLRTAKKNQAVGIADQQAAQAVQEESRLTKEKEMAVIRVAQTQQADIDRQVGVTQADKAKQVTVLQAEANLQTQIKNAEGVQANGLAKAKAEEALQLAPVTAQITLADKIGSDPGYQTYLVNIRQIEANQAVGIEQAKALEKAETKIIVNTGSPAAGLESARDLFTAKGGLGIGSMLEGLTQTETGKAVIETLTKNRA